MLKYMPNRTKTGLFMNDMKMRAIMLTQIKADSKEGGSYDIDFIIRNASIFQIMDFKSPLSTKKIVNTQVLKDYMFALRYYGESASIVKKTTNSLAVKI